MTELVGQRTAGGLAVAAEEFREAMALLASPLTIVATRDASGTPWGFTASSVTSVSLDPPLVLVCVAHTSSCHQALAQADEYTVNILSERHRPLAKLFATSGADRFAGGEFEEWEGSQLPYLPDATVSMRCSAFDSKTAGDHDVLFALPTQIRFNEESGPLIWYRRTFHSAY